MIIYASGLLYNILNLKSNDNFTGCCRWLIVIKANDKKELYGVPSFSTIALT